MKPFLHRFTRAGLRVIPRCITQTQAVAYNMFLASFPMMLVVFGAVASSAAVRDGLQGVIRGLRPVLPPGSLTIITNFLVRHSSNPWKWVLLGLGGTLLAGTQMMKLMIEGFRMVYGDPDRSNFLSRSLHALLLVTATIVPAIITINLIVFGKQLRGWMLNISSMPVLIRLIWGAVYACASLAIAMFVLAMIYRLGCPGPHTWDAVIPGAAVATVLWWVVSIALGFYLRHVPYSLVYGGLAVTIGILIWMQSTATILLIGAAYNAELQSSALAINPDLAPEETLSTESYLR